MDCGSAISHGNHGLMVAQDKAAGGEVLVVSNAAPSRPGRGPPKGDLSRSSAQDRFSQRLWPCLDSCKRRAVMGETVMNFRGKSHRIGVLLLVACMLGSTGTVAGQGQQPGPVPATAESAQREALAESTIARDEAAVGRQYDPKFREQVKKALASMSLDEIGAVPAGSSPLVFGDIFNDLVYNPVPPCRVIDTRVVGGRLNNSTRNFIVSGGPYTGQGGSPGSCGIPFPQATAVVVNFVAVDSLGAGDLRVFPFGTPPPNASVLNYASTTFNGGLNIANGIPVQLCFFCGFDITVLAEGGATHVVADVLGYFAPPSVLPTLWAVVNEDGTLARGFHAVSAAAAGSAGSYEVIFDRNVRNCAYVATIGLSGSSGTPGPGEIGVVGRNGNVNGVFVKTYDSTGAIATRGFHLAVHC